MESLHALVGTIHSHGGDVVRSGVGRVGVHHDGAHAELPREQRGHVHVPGLHPGEGAVSRAPEVTGGPESGAVVVPQLEFDAVHAVHGAGVELSGVANVHGLRRRRSADRYPIVAADVSLEGAADQSECAVFTGHKFLQKDAGFLGAEAERRVGVAHLDGVGNDRGGVEDTAIGCGSDKN